MRQPGVGCGTHIALSHEKVRLDLCRYDYKNVYLRIGKGVGEYKVVPADKLLWVVGEDLD